MIINRRAFVHRSLTGLAAAWAAPRASAHAKAKFKVGVTDWNLGLSSKLGAVALAGQCGFAGVQIALGLDLVDGKMALDNPELQQQYLADCKKHNVQLTSTCVDRLHKNYLKNDKLGQKWVLDAIRITKTFGVTVLLVPFFGPGALKTRAEMDYIGDVMRDLGPEAEKAGVILALENTNSAEDNVRMIERSRSEALQVYYDVGNSTRFGFDILKEIPWLGKARICEIHLKDGRNYLGEGKIDIPAVVAALAEIGFAEWAVLETSNPSKDVVADMTKNRTYVEGLIKAHNAA